MLGAELGHIAALSRPARGFYPGLSAGQFRRRCTTTRRASIASRAARRSTIGRSTGSLSGSSSGSTTRVRRAARSSTSRRRTSRAFLSPLQRGRHASVRRCVTTPSIPPTTAARRRSTSRQRSTSSTSVGGQFYSTELNTSFLGGRASRVRASRRWLRVARAAAATQDADASTRRSAATGRSSSAWHDRLFLTARCAWTTTARSVRTSSGSPTRR